MLLGMYICYRLWCREYHYTLSKGNIIYMVMQIVILLQKTCCGKFNIEFIGHKAEYFQLLYNSQVVIKVNYDYTTFAVLMKTIYQATISVNQMPFAIHNLQLQSLYVHITRKYDGWIFGSFYFYSLSIIHFKSKFLW